MRSAGPSWPAHFQENIAMRKLLLASTVAAALFVPALATQNTPCASAPATEQAAAPAQAEAPMKADHKATKEEHHAKKHHAKKHHHAKKAESAAPASSGK